MGKPSSQPCCGLVYQRGCQAALPCDNNGKSERAGKWYCGVHDPERLAAAQAVRDERERQEQDARTAANVKRMVRQGDIEAILRWAAKAHGLGCHECAWGDGAYICSGRRAGAIVAELDAEKGVL